MLAPLFLIVVDLIVRLRLNSYENLARWGPKDVGVYAVATVWSIATWTLFWRLVCAARPGLRRALIYGAVGLGAIVFGVGFAYTVGFDGAPSWQVIKFTVAEPRMAWFIASWSVHWSHGFALLALAGVLWAILRPGLTTRALPPLRRRWVAVSAVGYTGLTGLVMLAPGFQSPVPVDANTVAAFSQYALAVAGGPMHLTKPVRPPIPPQPQVPRPNVLVILNESLRADAVLPGLTYGSAPLDPRVLAPFISTLPSRGAEGYWVFPNARTNSTATESSVPAILSGFDPGGDTYAYGRAQSLWSVGRAAHASTFIFAAEAYTWSHFDEYFIDEFVDTALTGTELSVAVPTGSTAADDGAVVDAAIAHLEKLAAAGTPFVGVIHFDATHLPGWAGPGTPEFTGEHGDPAAYSAAVKYVDGLTERIVSAVNRLGLADNTVIVSTSDHGENIAPKRAPDRLGNYFDHIVRVPYWLRVPPKLLAQHPEWRGALAAWQAENPQNLDVMPTIRDALGLGDVAELGPSALAGRSLLRAPPADATVLGQSTCAFREWKLEGFFLVRGSTKIILSSNERAPLVYDLSVDPKEQKDLWPDPAWQARVRPWIEEALRSGAERRAVCARIGPACPFEVSAP